MTFAPRAGDLVVDSASTVILEPAGGLDKRVTITADVAANRLEFGRVTLAGVDVAARIANVRNTLGAGDSNVQTANIADQSVPLAKLGIVPVANGGTGLAGVPAGEVLFATAGGTQVRSSPALKADATGLVLGAGASLALADGADRAVLYEAGGDLLVAVNGGAPYNLSRAARGTAPAVDRLGLAGDELHFALTDRDGDLRSLHVAWFASSQAALTPADVFARATAASPADALEVHLIDAMNTGRATFSASVADVRMAGKFVYAVAEDGPGNLSPVAAAGGFVALGPAAQTFANSASLNEIAVDAEFAYTSAAAAGVLFEKGGSGSGVAVYVHGGRVYGVAGEGSILGDRSVRYELSLPIAPGAHPRAVLFAAGPAGARLALDGGGAGREASAGPKAWPVAGPDPGGIGRVHGSITANHGGWAASGDGVYPDAIDRVRVWFS